MSRFGRWQITDMVSKNQLYFWSSPISTIAKSVPILEETKHFVIEGNKIFFTALQAMGTFPFQREKSGRYTLRWRSFNGIYSVILYIITTVTTILFLMDRQQVMTEMVSKSGWTDESFINSYTLFFALYQTIPALLFMDIKKVEAYFEHCKDFQENFERFTRQTIRIDLRLLQIVHLTVMIISFGIYNCMYFFYLKQAHYQELLNYMPQSLELLITTYQFWLYTVPWGLWMFLSLTTSRVATQFLTALKSCDGSSRSLKQYRLLWRELRDLACEQGSALCWCTTFLLTCCFAVNLVMLYSTVAVDMGLPWYTFAGVQILEFSFIASIPEVSHRTSEKVGSDVQKEVQRRMKFALSADVEKELRKFDREIHKHPPVISLAGWVTMHRPLNIAMVSNVLTYLVVILQFRYG